MLRGRLNFSYHVKLKAATRNFNIVLIFEAPVNKSGRISVASQGDLMSWSVESSLFAAPLAPVKAVTVQHAELLR